MADQAVLEAHAFQCHVCGLAIGVSTWVSVCRKNIFPMTTMGPENLEQCHCLIAQRDAVWAALLHPLWWDSPDTPFEVDICPPSGCRLGRASHGVQLPFDQAAGCALDASVRDFQHELRKFLWW